MSSTFPLLLRPVNKRHGAYTQQAILNGQGPDAPLQQFLWRRNVQIGDFTAAAATSQQINLFTDLTSAALDRELQSGDFPADVWVNTSIAPHVRLITDFAGGAASAVTVEFGFTSDPDAFVTASSVFTGVAPATIWTPGASFDLARYEPALAPTISLNVTGANVADLTAGELEVQLSYIAAARG